VRSSAHDSAKSSKLVSMRNSARSSARIIGDKGRELFLERTVRMKLAIQNDRGDVPGWVLVVLMTTGLVTAIWTLAAPRIESILRNSLDSMNGIR
jgi:hypothetical protein